MKRSTSIFSILLAIVMVAGVTLPVLALGHSPDDPVPKTKYFVHATEQQLYKPGMEASVQVKELIINESVFKTCTDVSFTKKVNTEAEFASVYSKMEKPQKLLPGEYRYLKWKLSIKEGKLIRPPNLSNI